MKDNLYDICRYIAENDKNSDIMEAWMDCLEGKLPYDVFFGILVRIMADWKEDIEFAGATPREKAYFKILGI